MFFRGAEQCSCFFFSSFFFLFQPLANLTVTVFQSYFRARFANHSCRFARRTRERNGMLQVERFFLSFFFSLFPSARLTPREKKRALPDISSDMQIDKNRIKSNGKLFAALLRPSARYLYTCRTMPILFFFSHFYKI